MNVLSLFDGMSCGMIALDRLGIKVDNYYASEIDKYAIQVSQANYPDIIQVGDITKLDLSTLPKIDLVMGGSPCQGFSFAGKQLAFDDPRSALFFEFVKCVDTLKPKYFLLENVRMKKEYLDIISEYMGVEPIFINSSLVSAQSRQRYYWTNIPNVEQPKERGIVLRDILEDQPKKPTLMSNKFVARNGDRNCMIDKNKEKAHNLSAMEYVKNGRQGNYLACDEKGIPKHKPVKQTERNRRHLKQLDDKSLCMTATMYKGAENNGMTLVPQRVGTIKDGGQGNRIYSKDGKGITLSAQSGGTAGSGNMLVDDISDLPEKSSVIKANYYKSSKANFENDTTKGGKFSATGIPQKLVSDKPKHKEQDHLKQFKIKDETVPKYVPNEEGDFCDPYNKKMIKGDKSTTLRTNSSNGNTWIKQTSDKPQHIGTAVDVNGHDILKRVYSPDGKSPTVNTMGGGNREPKVVMGAYRGRYNEDGSTSQKLELRKDDKTNIITTVQKDNVLTQDEVYWRKLTPLECERLQTVPDNYTNHVSNTQRYKMLGNGWTIEVIAHILKNMEA